MKFGPVPVADSIGAITAHTIRLPDGRTIKKGVRIARADQDALQSAGVASIVAARLGEDDVHEDEAAYALAAHCAGQNLRLDTAATGRCNLFTNVNGIFVADGGEIDAVNAVDESITLATLPALHRVYAEDMVATVKIIPFAVAGAHLGASLRAASAGALRVAPFRPLHIGVVSTLLPALKPTTVDKTLRIFEERIAAARAWVSRELRVPHEAAALRAALRDVLPTSDLVVVFGASAITDRRDVIPTALQAAGGRIEHLGMPVDPGNLLLLGELDDEGRRVPMLGAPGCARSPKQNGFDFVLDRILADVPVGAADIRRMGAGGLLMEIASRPHPRVGDA